jgi:hypothetical protein
MSAPPDGLQSLWNWFLATTLNVTRISYWPMFGFNMLLQTVLERDTFSKEERWGRMMTMIDACVPVDKKDQVDEKLKEEHGALLTAGVEVFGTIVRNSLALLVGWADHAFLV